MTSISHGADGARGGVPFVGRWAWLFPPTYLVHIAEEYAAGEGFPAWFSRVTGGDLSPADFLWLNAAFWVVMTGLVALAARRPKAAPVLVALAALVLVNAALHLGGTALTGRYSPGLLSGLLLWAPLGFYGLRRAARTLPRSTVAAGALVGLISHMGVSALALAAGRAGALQ